VLLEEALFTADKPPMQFPSFSCESKRKVPDEAGRLGHPGLASPARQALHVSSFLQGTDLDDGDGEGADW